MEIRKIEKFEKHTENSYSVWYEGLGDNRACMSAARFKLAQCIDEFIRRGIDPNDINRIVALSGKLEEEEIFE